EALPQAPSLRTTFNPPSTLNLPSSYRRVRQADRAGTARLRTCGSLCEIAPVLTSYSCPSVGGGRPRAYFGHTRRIDDRGRPTLQRNAMPSARRIVVIRRVDISFIGDARAVASGRRRARDI